MLRSERGLTNTTEEGSPSGKATLQKVLSKCQILL
jgi:hypothetical protein